jgi:predicted membrane channel-forming protein YqfA (hemolysin III family)
VAWVWGGIAVLGTAGAILPSLVGMNGMAGGYALAFVSGFLALCGILIAAVFAARARVLRRLLSGQGVLAHWTYQSEDRADHVDRELAEERRGSWTLFLVILGFCLIIGVGFLIADPDAGRFVFFFLLGVAALLAVVAWLAPRLRHRRRRWATPEAMISLEGAYAFGMLHTWRLLGARVEEAELAQGKNPVLRVSYSAPMLYGKFFYSRQSYTVQIPVPPGEEDRAAHIVRALSGEPNGAP